jgi:hypothetical protein
MTKNEIVDWLDDFHDNLENHTDKTHLNLKDLLKLMPEEVGREYVRMANESFGEALNKEVSYDYVMSDQWPFTKKQLENLSDEQRQALAWDEHPDNPKFDDSEKKKERRLN